MFRLEVAESGAGVTGGEVPLHPLPRRLHNVLVEILGSRVLVRPTDRQRSIHFYRDLLGLAVYREFGEGDSEGVVFFLGGGFLEVSGSADSNPRMGVDLWIQVRDVCAEHDRLARLGVELHDVPQLQPWGLVELSLSDPDGLRIVLVEVPPEHPIRRDPRPASRRRPPR